VILHEHKLFDITDFALGCKDIWIKLSKFVAKTQFVCFKMKLQVLVHYTNVLKARGQFIKESKQNSKTLSNAYL